MVHFHVHKVAADVTGSFDYCCHRPPLFKEPISVTTNLTTTAVPIFDTIILTVQW